MKIKRKVQKQFTLPQLIEYAWDNGIDSRTFTSPKGGDISFDEYGDVVDVYSINPNDTFTVEEEINITEDTELDELVVRYRNGNIYIFQQERINDFKDNSNIIAFYIPNDDLTFTLIWTQEKGLVD